MKALFSEYSILGVLFLVGMVLSLATIAEQEPVGVSAARSLTGVILETTAPGARIFIVARPTADDREFVDSLALELPKHGRIVVETASGEPPEIGAALRRLAQAGAKLNIIAASSARSASLPVLHQQSALGSPRVMSPPTYYWPNFLKLSNLLNIANQMAVIAMIAIGMTMVIITRGIDLSVGSLMALAAVSATWMIREWAGAYQATALGMVLSCLGAILITATVGLVTGLIVTRFGVPPFIVTLAMLLMASGAARKIADNQTIFQLPQSFQWLGLGADLGPIPNAVVLTGLLYLAANVVMTRTVWGRYIYAVGSNPRAARFAGVPVVKTILSVYVVTGALAGLGGVVLASNLGSGSPLYGEGYELSVIAASVVGGASLSGGEGKIFGTLIGSFLIAMIQNGMNLLGMESNAQKIVLGAVILGAVLIDRIKKQGLGWPRD